MSDSASSEASSRYQVVTELGQGGMARVNLVLSRGRAGVSKLLVTKEILPGLKEDPDLVEMFLDEARLSVRLNHPNVVQTYEVVTNGEHPLIVMEYLDGQSLLALLRRVGREEMSLDMHLYVLTQVLAGLHHAHELCDLDGTPLNVVHRDVSPQNVFITYDGQVKLVDFGIAKAARMNRRTRTGVFKGKVTYAAPEQVKGEKVDRRCDIFSFGVMLWEALARRRLVGPEIDIVAMQQRANGEEPRIDEVAPETPPQLAHICNKAMARDPADRYATAEELRVELVAQLDRSARSGAHDLAELMRKVFEQERSQIRKVIETRIKELGSGETPPPGAVATPIALTPREVTPSRPTQPDVDPHEPPEGSTAKSASLTPPLPRTGRGLRGTLVLISFLVVAVGLTIVQLVRRTPADGSGLATGFPAATLPAPTASPTEQAPATPTVEVSITVQPPSARVFFDDVELASNPFHGALPKSAVARRVRATAPGFTPEERLMVFDRDVHVELQLRPAPTATEAPVIVRRPAGGPSTATTTTTTPIATPSVTARPGDTVPGATTSPHRPIDDTF